MKHELGVSSCWI